MNRLMLSGNLGSDPELRYTPNGSEVATFSLATSHKYTTSSGEKREETTWFKVSAFGKTAVSCNEYLERGSFVVVLGRLKASPWVGKDGQAQAGLECVAESVEFGPRRAKRQGRHEVAAAYLKDALKLVNVDTVVVCLKSSRRIPDF